MFERQSALAGVSLPLDGRGVRIGEARGWSLLQIAAFPSTHADLRGLLSANMGAELPTSIGPVVAAGRHRVLKTGAEQYWILSADGDEFECPVPPDMGAVTSLSHSRTCIFIEGNGARSLLAKGVPLDFHPEVFRVDQFALTGVHHTPVLIHRSGENRYEIYALRTYALSVWEWVVDAAA